MWRWRKEQSQVSGLSSWIDIGGVDWDGLDLESLQGITQIQGRVQGEDVTKEIEKNQKQGITDQESDEREAFQEETPNFSFWFPPAVYFSIWLVWNHWSFYLWYNSIIYHEWILLFSLAKISTALHRAN